MPHKIWVDADACPKVIKEILFRAVKRTQVPMTLVANRPLYTPPSDLIDSIMVPQGFDVADEAIVDRVGGNELVITEDIPLAAAVIEKGAVVLTTHGRMLNAGNIGEALSVRNFMDEVRSAGVQTGGPAAFSRRDREKFANALQRLMG